MRYYHPCLFASLVVLVLTSTVSASEEEVRVRYRVPRSTRQTCGVDSLFVCLKTSGQAEGLRLANLAEDLPLSPNGLSVEDLVRAANRCSVSTTAVWFSSTTPCEWHCDMILHVNDNHFIVWHGIDAGRYVLFDSSIGLLDCSPEWFAKRYRWNGFALVVGSPSVSLAVGLYGPAIALVVIGLLAILLSIHRLWFRSSSRTGVPSL
jgi:hypothetical protein